MVGFRDRGRVREGEDGKSQVRNTVLDVNCHREKEGKQSLTIDAVAGSGLGDEG